MSAETNMNRHQLNLVIQGLTPDIAAKSVDEYKNYYYHSRKAESISFDINAYGYSAPKNRIKNIERVNKHEADAAKACSQIERLKIRLVNECQFAIYEPNT